MDESFIIANRTDVGRTRDVNEDSMVTFDSPNGRVVAVCDGMGGQAAGDVASRLACDIITDILSNNTFASPTEAITRACIAANQGILHRAAQNPELEGMGATCVMVIIKGGQVYYGWIGDSRIYYIADGNITQISRDQSYVQQLVDTGQITAAEAETHPLKNEITNALGLPSMTPPQLCSVPLVPAPGSVILLCSDGLSGMVDNNTIREIVSDSELTLQRRADKLIDKANANGGQDNITVQLIQFGKAPAAAPSGLKAVAGGKPSMFTWIAIALAVVIIALLAWFFMKSDDEKKEEKPATEQIQDTRPAATAPAPAPAAKKTVEVKEVVHDSGKSSKQTKREQRSNKVDKARQNTFGRSGGKAQNPVVNPNNPGASSQHESDPSIEERFKDK